MSKARAMIIIYYLHYKLSLSKVIFLRDIIDCMDTWLIFLRLKHSNQKFQEQNIYRQINLNYTNKC